MLNIRANNRPMASDASLCIQQGAPEGNSMQTSALNPNSWNSARRRLPRKHQLLPYSNEASKGVAAQFNTHKQLQLQPFIPLVKTSLDMSATEADSIKRCTRAAHRRPIEKERQQTQ